MVKQKVKVPSVSIPQKEEGQSIVPANDAEVFQVVEHRDEEQIIASLEGKYLDEYVYSFQQGGKSIEGLSWLGIQEAARAYGGIQCPIDKMKIERNDKDIIVMIEAIDSQTNSSAIGASAQALFMTTSRGVMADSFAMQKAISKAQRNAKRQLLPQQLLKQWIEKHRKAKSGIVDNGSNKAIIDAFHAAWKEMGMSMDYVINNMQKKYGVKNTAQLSKDQIMEFTAWVTSHKKVEEAASEKVKV